MSNFKSFSALLLAALHLPDAGFIAIGNDARQIRIYPNQGGAMVDIAFYRQCEWIFTAFVHFNEDGSVYPHELNELNQAIQHFFSTGVIHDSGVVL